MMVTDDMVTDDDHTYYGDHFIMYKNFDSL